MAIELEDRRIEEVPPLDWDQWTDGKWYALVQGEDFPEGPINKFRNRVYSAASRRGLKARTHAPTLQDDELPESVRELLEEGKTVLMIVFYPENGHAPAGRPL